MIKVVIADDHHLFRESIKSLLETTDDIEVVGEASDGQETLKLIQRKRPDVALVDIAMPLLNGIETTYRIQSLDVGTRVVILSMYSDEDMVRQALKNGAKGYLLKRSLVEELLLAIRSASKDEVYLSPSVARSVLTGYLQNETDDRTLSPVDRLSSREREVLQLIAEGHTNQATAHLLNISAKTVETHRTNLTKKLEARNLPDLVRIALKYRLTFLDK
ncbi:MAG: response regulator transcription factor [Gemmatimonadetes bacterium]|nr:response regulator transcription factor [Gemmatimonadota bacterium]MYB62745.1 response regulator transcription factor [Gemmatimonadota bacterium]